MWKIVQGKNRTNQWSGEAGERGYPQLKEAEISYERNDPPHQFDIRGKGDATGICSLPTKKRYREGAAGEGLSPLIDGRGAWLKKEEEFRVERWSRHPTGVIWGVRGGILFEREERPALRKCFLGYWGSGAPNGTCHHGGEIFACWWGKGRRVVYALLLESPFCGLLGGRFTRNPNSNLARNVTGGRKTWGRRADL